MNDALDQLERDTAELAAGLKNGLPQVDKRKQGLYAHSCGGLHFVQAVLSWARFAPVKKAWGARVDQQRFRMGYLNHDERRKLHEAAGSLVEAPLFIDDTPGTTIMDVHAKLRRLRNEHGLALVVIDYLQLMSSRGRSENRNQEISAMSRGLKLLANELQVPFMVLSQLSRAPEQRPGDHRPQLSDLRESGSIEQDADLVAFIYREEVYKPEREDLRGLADMILAKQRNGPTGVVKLVFLKESTKFENRTSDMEDTDE